MGEIKESLEIENVRNHPENQIDEVFERLSQQDEGLNFLDTDELMEIIQSRDNVDEIIYGFKFIEDKSIFEQICQSEAEDFKKLDENQKKEISKYAKGFYNTLTNIPVVRNFSSIKPGEKGILLAFIFVNQELNTKNDERMYIAWKEEKEKDLNIFSKILEEVRKALKEKVKVKINETFFPDELRTSSNIILHEDKENVSINFEGSSKYEVGAYIYAPNLISNFDEYIKAAFEERFPGKKIRIIY